MPVEVHTEWCAPMVVVPKANGEVRICVDLTRLNKAVCRERIMLPTVDRMLSQMAGARVFSKLDANQGYHQLPLHKDSQPLTTFVTLIGRFMYCRLPFGISSGPEIFQKKVTDILGSVEGCVCLMDDIVVYGKDQNEHDSRLSVVLERLCKAGVTLNMQKCEFNRSEIRFLGHCVSDTGVTADKCKVSAIQELPAPRDVHEVRRLLGMVN